MGQRVDLVERGLRLTGQLGPGEGAQCGLVRDEAITQQYIPLYQRIGELDPSERDASDLLVAHEAALRAFARAELSGETETSLEQINALAHMH